MTELSPLAWRLRRCLLSLERERILLAEVWACLLEMAPDLLTDPGALGSIRRRATVTISAPDSRTACFI